MPNEQGDFASAIVERWIETHKKSMLTFVILTALNDTPMWSRQLSEWVKRTTGWRLTERGLHRTLQRMANLELIQYKKTNSPKSGADRKVYQVTEFGVKIARSIQTEGLSYLQNEPYAKLLTRR